MSRQVKHQNSSRLKAANSVADVRALAKKRLPHGLFEFVARGCEDELSIRENRAALDRVKLYPRGLVDVSKVSTQAEIFGKPVSNPFGIGPTGAAGLLWYQGELELARAASKAGVPFTVATGSLTPVEEIADQAPGRLWFQLYMWPDRQLSYELLDRVKAAGFEALVVTIDLAGSPKRDYNKRNGFTVPMRINHKNAVDGALHPQWLLSVMGRYMINGGVPRHENYPESLRRSLAEAPSKKFPKNDSLTWDDLKELRKRWGGPLIVKGLLHPDDARKAAECGADGVVVSNHGGRNFDAAPSSIEALPYVADAVGHKLTVMTDSGYSSGTDIVKALANGAKFVLMGKAPLFGVAAAGEAGVSRMLQILSEDVERAMRFMGCRTVEEIDRSFLFSASNAPVASSEKSKA